MSKSALSFSLSFSEADVSGAQWSYDPGVLSTWFSQQQSSQRFLSVPLPVSSIPLGCAENLASFFSQRGLSLHQQHERGRRGWEVRTRSEVGKRGLTHPKPPTRTFLLSPYAPAVTRFPRLLTGGDVKPLKHVNMPYAIWDRSCPRELFQVHTKAIDYILFSGEERRARSVWVICLFLLRFDWNVKTVCVKYCTSLSEVFTCIFKDGDTLRWSFLEALDDISYYPPHD